MAVEKNMQLKQALAMAKSAPLLVAAAAAPGLAGGASTMSGLASIGAMAGAGAAVGVVMISAAPAALGVLGIRNAVRGAGADQQSTNVTTLAAAGGATVGTAGVAATFIGASGSGITSTLAACGGGSLAAGGWGLAGGLIMVAAVPLTCAAVVGGTAFAVKQKWVNDEYCKTMQMWQAMGGSMGGGGGSVAAH